VNFQQTLDYLYNTLPMFSRMGSAAFKKDLTNIQFLCKELGNPQQQFKSIHIGGTNGKGSVSHMLAAIFQANGYKTGLYTSPHLYDFRERIRLDGQMVSEQFVIDFVERIKPVSEKIEPSFFEMTVAMAFQAFAEAKVDIAVIEVGLGGRLDSTNIITPELSIITNIGWDHMNLLGDSLQQIAEEKAGIMKPKVPVVIGEAIPETREVFEDTASKRPSPIVFAEALYGIEGFELLGNYLQVNYQDHKQLVAVESDLQGVYQVKNIRTVLAALSVLKQKNWKFSDEKTAFAFKHAKKLTGLQGRWEVVQQSPKIVLEVAHNKEGIEQMLKHIQHLSYRQLHIVFGMVKDKDAVSVLSLLPTYARYYFTQANIPRALPGKELQEKAGKLNLAGKRFENVNLAIQEAMLHSESEDLIIVCGSIFLVAEVDRAMFRSKARTIKL
jgi:dihydrofolate synthase / folylpolyglutamate synthase